ncbi:hypothetical protein HPB49_025409 [Dermacentor silvarum]|uniref:Uncharacterized protein n=1 Tax=Dermacentor silvarum TaxID=543639 RepID=A0ACB8E4V8_DERSI|nr:hypothetical protein HPB49_025409 [Dermacentor silvarum]
MLHRDSEIDELEGPTVHYKPEAIETLCQLTKFNKRELQLMYRGFKQECPSGMVKEETFKIIYSQFFPRGADASQYAHFVFNTFDQDHTGAITFTDFVIGLSVLSRGSLQEKLRWTFNLYDINGDGYITKDELARIVKAVYDLMGKAVEPMVEENTTREHVERVFQKLDLNKDGVVTIDEFMDSCTKLVYYIGGAMCSGCIMVALQEVTSQLEKRPRPYAGPTWMDDLADLGPSLVNQVGPRPELVIGLTPADLWLQHRPKADV